MFGQLKWTNCWMGTEEEEVVPKNKHHRVAVVASGPISGAWGGVWSWHQTRKPCGDLAFSRKRRWRSWVWSVGKLDMICCSLICMIYHSIVSNGTQWSLSPYVPKLFDWRRIHPRFHVSCFSQLPRVSSIRCSVLVALNAAMLGIGGSYQTTCIEKSRRWTSFYLFFGLKCLRLEFQNPRPIQPHWYTERKLEAFVNSTLRYNPYAPGVLLLWWPLPLAPRGASASRIHVHPSVLQGSKDDCSENPVKLVDDVWWVLTRVGYPIRINKRKSVFGGFAADHYRGLQLIMDYMIL